MDFKNKKCRSQFIVNLGCEIKSNGQGYYSFVNHNQKYVVFGLDVRNENVILNESWGTKGVNEGIKHINLIQSGYKLFIYEFETKDNKDGRTSIATKDFSNLKIKEKTLKVGDGLYYAL
ncbi:TPA: hypothetical protein ACX6QU_001510 [Photobacterium damselae]